MPDDLVPLSTMPWDERPAELPLDIEECRTALWLTRGNVSKAAEKLKVDPARLRRFVSKSVRLNEVLKEAREQLADIAENNILDALMDREDYARRDSMSKFVLTTLGKERGFSTSVTVSPSSRLPSGPIEFSWATSPVIDHEKDDNGPVIDHEPAK